MPRARDSKMRGNYTKCPDCGDELTLKYLKYDHPQRCKLRLKLLEKQEEDEIEIDDKDIVYDFDDLPTDDAPGYYPEDDMPVPTDPLPVDDDESLRQKYPQSVNEIWMKNPSLNERYKSEIRKILKEVFDNVELVDLNDWIDSMPEILKNIRDRKIQYSSKSSSVFQIIQMLKAIGATKSELEYFNDYFKEMKKLSQGFSKPSEKELEQFEPWSFVEKTRDLYESKDLTDKFNSDAFLMLSLVTHLPPMRAQDYYSTIIYKGKDLPTTGNYISLRNNTWVINSHKTEKVYKQKTIPIPSDLMKLIKQHVDQFKIDKLISANNGVQMNRFWGKVFGQNLAQNMLRKIHNSIMLENKTADELEDIAYTMGHSVSTQQRVYTKFNTTLHPTNF